VAYPYVLVGLSAVTRTDLRELLRDAWRMMGGSG
jgi:hypothetical protein